jgi:hypothetical protein
VPHPAKQLTHAAANSSTTSVQIHLQPNVTTKWIRKAVGEGKTRASHIPLKHIMLVNSIPPIPGIERGFLCMN